MINYPPALSSVPLSLFVFWIPSLITDQTENALSSSSHPGTLVSQSAATCLDKCPHPSSPVFNYSPLLMTLDFHCFQKLQIPSPCFSSLTQCWEQTFFIRSPYLLMYDLVLTQYVCLLYSSATPSTNSSGRQRLSHMANRKTFFYRMDSWINHCFEAFKKNQKREMSWMSILGCSSVCNEQLWSCICGRMASPIQCGFLVISTASLFTLITSFAKHTLTQRENLAGV